MNLTPGQRLGPYEIVAPLGAGGMGEVYRARDGRLDREVAVKVLPPRIARNEDALARFEREAKAVAALSHPNVLALHDFATSDDGTAYAVMELLDGRTLGEALEQGPLPQRRAVEIARQIARGLASAHDGGVVHRDLKPDNVFLTRDGRVKILDFGLARVAGEATSDSSPDGATRTSLTSPGSVMGTVNYMSPEQARGHPAGTVSDIFALGTVLHEMLSGRRPFERETAPETLTAVLREDPPQITREGVSPAVIRIVHRCLEKEPEQRFHSAHDLAFALESTLQSSGSGSTRIAAATTPVRTRRGALVPALVALAAGIALGALGASLLRPTPLPPPVKIRPLTFSGVDGEPTVSPDGRMVAFASRRGESPALRIKQLAGGNDVALTRGADTKPRFSPDGSALLFTRTDAGVSSIFRVPVVGGEPRKLIDDALEADWSPDGTRVAFIRGAAGRSPAIGVANADGSLERIVVAGELGRTWRSPRWSPDGRTLAFVARFTNNNVPLAVMLLDLDDGELRELAPRRPSVSGLAWSRSGRELLFAWSDDLLAGQASHESLVVMQNVDDGTTRELFWTRDMLHLQDGAELQIAGPETIVFGVLARQQNLMLSVPDDDGDEALRTLTSGNSVDRQPKLAPDGETVLFASNRTGALDLWTLNRRTGEVRQLTDDEARDWDPAFSRDGREILWSSDRSGNLEIWMANADGSGARQVTDDGVDAENPTATPDGEWIVYMTSNPAHPGLWKIRRDGSEATQLWSGSAFIPELSPDGRYAAFVVAARETNVLQTIDIETGELLPFRIEVPRPTRRPAGAIGRSRWIDGGRAIAFTGADGDRIGVYVQAFDPDGVTDDTRRAVAGFDDEWRTESFDITADGRVVILSRVRPGGTVMLAENVPLVR